MFSKWIYRGEGNRTLVIANPKTREVLRLEKSTIASKDQPNLCILQNANRKESECLRKKMEKCIKFTKQVFIPLIGEKYVECGAIVDLPEDFISKNKDLVTSANKERPNFRLNKEVNGQTKFGILVPDFCFVPGDGVYANEIEGNATVPTFCVEIKPKYGTLPACEGIGTSLYRDVKQTICKYCLMQWTKVNKERKYPQRSGYCPLDLFSSDVKRVWHALICLLKDPQNNLRIFQNGKRVYSGEMATPSYDQLDNGKLTDKVPSKNGTIEHQQHLLQPEEVLRHSFGSLYSTNHKLHGEIDGTNLTSTTIFLLTLLQLLIHDSNETTIHHCPSRNHHSLGHPVCNASQYNEGMYSPGIPTWLMSKGLGFGQGGVFRKILDVQKMDSIGTDKAFSIFSELRDYGLKDVIDSFTYTLNESSPKCCVDVHKNAQNNDLCDGIQLFNAKSDSAHTNNDCDKPIKNGYIYSSNDLSIASKLDSLSKFLIAASANDCSIMISFQEAMDATSTDASCFEDVLTRKIYKYSIAVVDLDQKGSGRVEKYYKEYRDIIDNYLHFYQIN